MYKVKETLGGLEPKPIQAMISREPVPNKPSYLATSEHIPSQSCSSRKEKHKQQKKLQRCQNLRRPQLNAPEKVDCGDLIGDGPIFSFI
jgi:hypothetical protein